MSNINTIRSNINNYYNKKKEEYTQYRIQKHNDYWNKYYQDKNWYALRNNYYNLHPVCECHEKLGIIVPTEEIHHLKRFSSGTTEEAKYNLLLNPNNLCALCKFCHKIARDIMRQQNKDYISLDELVEHVKNYDDIH